MLNIYVYSACFACMRGPIRRASLAAPAIFLRFEAALSSNLRILSCDIVPKNLLSGLGTRNASETQPLTAERGTQTGRRRWNAERRNANPPLRDSFEEGMQSIMM